MTLKFAVLGHPVAHSLSPLIHATFYQRHRVDATYERADVPAADLPGWLSELATSGRYQGLSVTYPHKEALFEATGPHDEVATACRAVNTLSRQIPGDRSHGKPPPGKVPYRGLNTDGEGLALFLERELGFDVRGRTVAVLGAGGAARSTLWALAARGPARLTIVNRTRSRFDDPFFRALQDRSGQGRIDLLDLEAQSPRLEPELAGADLVIHATPFGLARAGGADARPLWPIESLVRPLVVDLNYRVGAPTPFLALLPANARGHDGKGMLLYQAAVAFRHWFGHLPDTSGMLAKLSSVTPKP